MRLAFVESLTEYSREHDDSFLIVGDLGYGVVEPFEAEFPDRFINAGVAEQNMLGMAAGLASTGKLVFVYSIANFPSLRALEQVRNDIAYHGFPVVIVSVGAGLSYGTLGYSHHAVEDVSIMRAIPGINVYSPADDAEASAAFARIVKKREPAYLRIGKGGEREVHPHPLGDISDPIALCESGAPYLVLSHGQIASEVALALAVLKQESGIEVDHFSVPSLSSLELESISVRSRKALVTIEEHSIHGGFGSRVLELLSEGRHLIPTNRIGLDAPSLKVVGNQSYLRQAHGIDSASLAAKMTRFFKTV